MEAAKEFFNKLIETKDTIGVARIGEVVKVEGNTLDVQPLPTSSYSIVLGVPAIQLGNKEMYIHIPYQVGDKVLLVYLDESPDSPGGYLKHSDSHCVVVGRVSPVSTTSEAVEVVYGDSRIDIKKDSININASTINISGDSVTVSGSSESNSWQ